MTLPPEVPIQKYHKMSGGGDHAGYWVDALGWIVSYFAYLEGLSYAIVDRLGSVRDQRRVAKMAYQERTEFAKMLVCAHLLRRGDANLAAERDALLTEARASAPLRNKILHNPLGVNMAALGSIKDPDQGIVLTNVRGRPVFKLGAVQAFSNSMQAISIRMLDLMQRSQL
jgi:hypothetical protein